METTTRTTKHFEFTGETKELDTDITLITLHRIRATVETMHANIGDIGGWVEKPDNLCNNAWVSDNACVYGNAHVSGSAHVFGNAHIFGGACVYGNARVYGRAWVSDNACVLDNACVYGHAGIGGNTIVSGNAIVSSAWVSDNACVYGNAYVYGNACVSGNACVYGDARVYGKAKISGNANIKSHNDHCGFDSFGSDVMYMNAYRTTNGIEIISGKFRGSLDEYADRIKKTYSGNEYKKQYDLIIRLIKLKFNLQD